MATEIHEVHERIVRPSRLYTDENTTYVATPAYAVVYYILDILEIVLGLRLLFQLLGASTYNGFISFLYGITNPLVAPFRGIIPSGGAIVEWSTVVAMLVYALIAYLIVSLVRMSDKSYTV